MSNRKLFYVLNGLLLAMLGILWASGAAWSAREPGPGSAQAIHLLVGLSFPVILLLAVARLCRSGRPGMRGMTVRLSYILLLLTTVVGALAWGVRLPHVETLHAWFAIGALVPVVIAVALTVLRGADSGPQD
ncbi:hypothetical protein [Actibacterium ureilyticum]|uniref:hypothetical protein n=1 Tax=Actibacterium ureilyticum TaxID=1590614 RepID=UPI001140A4FF|nr:hypothetical protein [Actibacterium ureilyticum]